MPAHDHIRILLCTCNGARWLPEQLESFARQTHPSWSLWVSDDGSRDATREVIAAFGRRHPGRLDRVLDGPGRGSAANYLHLITHPELPAGPVALSDQDDVWRPEKLARAARVLQPGAPGADGPRAYAARYYVTDAALQRPRLSAGWPRGASFRNALVQNVMSGHTTVMNAAALARVRAAGAPDVPHHDWWLYLLLAATGCEIHLDPAGVLYYRQHAENVFGDRRGHRARLARMRFLRRESRAARWIAANIDALAGAGLALTPEAQRAVEILRDSRARPGLRRLRAFRQIGVHRQTRRESWAMELAVAMGRL
jgi:glycosyltransferase involved in cell wall biosynthesis